MQNVIKAIVGSGGRIYEVGGCVRDRLLGRASKDTDYLVTSVPMEKLIVLLKNYGDVNLVGKSFGVIKFTLGGETYDIALPRKEVSTGIGHRDFSVDVSHKISLDEDLFRRDFTINAIACDAVSGAFIDPFGGAHDIHDKLIRIVNPDSFVDDPLRMLRAVQFAARFGFTLSPETFRSMKRHAALVMAISPERISGELVKLLLSDKPSIGFNLMKETGLLEYVHPELHANIGVPQPSKYHAHDVYGHLMLAVDSCIPRKHGRDKNALLEMRLVMLHHDIAKFETITYKEDGTPQFLGHDEVGAEMTRGILERLRFTSVDGVTVNVDRICDLIFDHMFCCGSDSTAKSVRKFISTCRRNGKYGMDYVFDLLRVRCADRLGKGISVDLSEWVALARRIRTIRHGARDTAFGLKDLAINGRDLIEFGMKPGKAMGTVLAGMLEAVLDDPSVNRRDVLLSFLEKTEVGIVFRRSEET